MWWKILLWFVLTVLVLLFASSTWGHFASGGAEPSEGHMATDSLGFRLSLLQTLHSPWYWTMVAVILLGSGWVLKHWLSRT